MKNFTHDKLKLLKACGDSKHFREYLQTVQLSKDKVSSADGFQAVSMRLENTLKEDAYFNIKDIKPKKYDSLISYFSNKNNIEKLQDFEAWPEALARLDSLDNQKFEFKCELNADLANKLLQELSFYSKKAFREGFLYVELNAQGLKISFKTDEPKYGSAYFNAGMIINILTYAATTQQTAMISLSNDERIIKAEIDDVKYFLCCMLRKK